MISFSKTRPYARSTMERAIEVSSQFAHVSLADIANTFEKIESGWNIDFDHRYNCGPDPRTGKDFWYTRSFSSASTNSFFHPDAFICTRYPGTQPARGYWVEPTFYLFESLFGCICHLCQNPTATTLGFPDTMDAFPRFIRLTTSRKGDTRHASTTHTHCVECADLMRRHSSIRITTEDVDAALMSHAINRNSNLHKRLVKASQVPLRFNIRSELDCPFPIDGPFDYLCYDQ